jgi:uncharacterized membrane protein YgaE (UPF0421/DUF939 family)
MVQFPFTAFQKGVERITGRVLGVFYGLILTLFLRDAPFLFLALMLFGQIVFFYVYASGRLAYAALMGGLFLGVVCAIGLAAPETVTTYARDLIIQVVLGVAMAFFVNWFSGAERILTIETGQGSLWPPRLDWLNISAIVSTGQIVTMFVTVWLELPVLPTMISAGILGITAMTPQAMEQKGIQRALGAILGAAYATAALVLISYMPYFLLLFLLNFAGMFLAAYWTKASVKHSYAFLQMGMVMPMVLIGWTGMVGTIDTGIQRLIGVAVGLAAAEIVYLFWPFRLMPSAVVAQAAAAAGAQRR